MKSKEHSDKQILLINKWLEKWRGGTVRLWDYTVSHKTLIIRITHSSKSGNLHICCGDVSHIACSTAWENSGFELDTSSTETDDQYRLTDKNHGYYLVCGVIEVKENVKPL